jgi:hypothetical protein
LAISARKHKEIMRVTGQELCGAPVFE